MSRANGRVILEVNEMRVLRLRPSAAPRYATGQWRGFLVPLAVAALVLPSSISRAVTFTVTKTADTNGTCNSGVNCSLREAINAANDETNNPGADAIVFAAGVSGTINLNSALPNISTDIDVQGPGANLLEVTRASGVDFSIFAIGSPSSAPTVSISGLSITNGHIEDCGGGGISGVNGTLTVSNCSISRNTAGCGGGIYAEFANLTVTNCTLSGNSAISFGGGISSSGPSLIVRNSTLDGNSVTSGQGGGIYRVAVNGTLTLRNDTLSGNSASDAGGGIAQVGDGGVVNATVSNSTLSGNSASNGGGIYNVGFNGANALVSLDNTILASTSAMPGANLVNVGLGTSITSEGYNLSSDDGGGFLSAAGDQINTDPKLGPLQDNGGPTETMALLPGSPAQDQGKSFGVTSDQRGFPRPVDIPSIPNASGGDGSDIGAVEMDAGQSGPTFVVTTTADHDDGTCSFDDCTLREAIKVANIASGANSIIFNSDVTGVITLQSALGPLTVTDSVSITGSETRFLAVSGNSAIRVFSFSSGSSSISGLTISNGAVTGTAGSGGGGAGGGILNAQNAALTLSDCTFNGNHVQGADNATAAGVGGSGNGGAIANSGVITLNRCTFFGNSAVGGRGGDGSGASAATLMAAAAAQDWAGPSSMIRPLP